jgi:hypothetical protein
LTEFKKLCVCALCNSLAKSSLAWYLRSNQECDLWQHRFASEIPNLLSIAWPINFTDFTKLLVHFYDWFWLVFIGLQTGVDNLLSVIRTATCLCTFKATSNTDGKRGIKVKNRLCFTDNLFEVDSLIFCSWESVNQVILQLE